jgi:ABC-type Fe3+/spermidine/putrescine transport system ATPase subunit
MRKRSDPPIGWQVSALTCRRVSVDYGGRRALRDVSLVVRSGEVVALLGASGSGKSTLLNAIAGLVPVAGGQIWLYGIEVADGQLSVPPERRDVGVVFQNFALWPHLSVIDTVAYPLRRRGRSRSAAQAQALVLLERLGIDQLARRRPAELSGGEQQRVGLARALARDARLYLLDEPTAHLDTHLRTAFLDSVRERQQATGAAIVYATHDAGEALAIADRIGLVVDGQLVQLASPQDCYAEPATEAAARLSGPCSVLSATVRAHDGGLLVDWGGGSVMVPGGGIAPGPARPVPIVVRPDWVREGGPFRGQIRVVAFRGPGTDYQVQVGGATGLTGATVEVRLPGPPRYAVGDTFAWGLERAWALDVAGAPDPQTTRPSDSPRVADPVQPSAMIAPG